MKKDNNNRRKAAIGAVIAAGVTTGAMAIAGTPSQGPKTRVAELTAADVVMIDGQQVSLDDTIRDRHVVRPMYGVRQDRPKLVYGPPPKSTDFNIMPDIEKTPITDPAVVADSVFSIIARYANVDVNSLDTSMSLRKNLHLKRADVDKMVVEIERMFNLVIPRKTVRSFKSVGQIINYVVSEVR